MVPDLNVFLYFKRKIGKKNENLVRDIFRELFLLPLFFLLEKETYHESKLYWWIFKCAVLNGNELGILYIYYIDTYKFLIIHISRIKVMKVLTIGILLHIVLLSIFVFPINWSQVRVFHIFVHSGILMHICNSIIIIMHLQTPIY